MTRYFVFSLSSAIGVRGETHTKSLLSLYVLFLEYPLAYCGIGMSGLHCGSGIGLPATVSSGITPAHVGNE